MYGKFDHFSTSGATLREAATTEDAVQQRLPQSGFVLGRSEPVHWVLIEDSVLVL